MYWPCITSVHPIHLARQLAKFSFQLGVLLVYIMSTNMDPTTEIQSIPFMATFLDYQQVLLTES